jgi:hypothetical protein
LQIFAAGVGSARKQAEWLVLSDMTAQAELAGIDAALAATVARLATDDEAWPASLLGALVQRAALRGIAPGPARTLLLSRLDRLCAEAAFATAGLYAAADTPDAVGNAGPLGGSFVAIARRAYFSAQVDEAEMLRRVDELADLILGPETMPA